ncbi:MAG: type II toxin-antitoxin system RelE/ParE family toxin [Patescibacteria group bacterium]
MYSLFYAQSARDDLKRLDHSVASRILRKLDFFIKQKNPLEFAKKLKNFNIGDYRFRVGDYRVIFDINSRGVIAVLMVLRIKHRKDVYDF